MYKDENAVRLVLLEEERINETLDSIYKLKKDYAQLY